MIDQQLIIEYIKNDRTTNNNIISRMIEQLIIEYQEW